MNPNHLPNDEISPSEMKYGTKIDIVVLDEKDNKKYYIPAVVGDAKEHSSPDGLWYYFNKWKIECKYNK